VRKILIIKFKNSSEKMSQCLANRADRMLVPQSVQRYEDDIGIWIIATTQL